MITLIKLAINVIIGIVLMLLLLIRTPFFMDIILNYKTSIKDWKTLPKGYKQILVTFDTFHRYYTINPDAYKLKTNFDSHPVRDDYIFQFSSYREWRKYQKWLNNKVSLEKNNNNEKEFTDIL